MGTQRHSGFNLEALEAGQADLITGSNFIGVHNIHKNYLGTGAGAATLFGASTVEQIMVLVPSMSAADLQDYESIVCEAYFEITGTNDKKYIWFQDTGVALLETNAIATVTDGTTTEFAATIVGVVRVKFTLQAQSGGNKFTWDTDVQHSGSPHSAMGVGTISHNPTTDTDSLVIAGKCDNVADAIIPFHSEYYLTKRSI